MASVAVRMYIFQVNRIEAKCEITAKHLFKVEVSHMTKKERGRENNRFMSLYVDPTLYICGSKIGFEL